VQIANHSQRTKQTIDFMKINTKKRNLTNTNSHAHIQIL